MGPARDNIGVRASRPCDESAAASGTAAAAGGGAAAESAGEESAGEESDCGCACTFAAISLVAGCGLTVELTADGSGQREATTDCAASAPGALSSLTAGLAGIASARPSLRLGGSMLVCGGSSARASATERCIGAAATG